VKCYVDGCLNPVKWRVWIDDSLCCDDHAEDIGSYVEQLESN